jgi:hypothetical protein
LVAIDNKTGTPPMLSQEEVELALVGDEAVDDEYEAHLVGDSSSMSSEMATWIAAANAMMIWPWLMPWYFWTQLFRGQRKEEKANG